ncbi:MAG: RNA polymerase sigma factor [Actinobacteria bacterium]|nr:RNA polymerase sigma factor [Actinomycetota bacterium]
MNVMRLLCKSSLGVVEEMVIEKHEDQIANELKSGKIEVFSEIINLYQSKLYHVAYKIVYSKDDAQDIVQDVFMQVLLKIQQWHGQNFSSWLFHMTRNRAIDYLRKKRKPDIRENEGIDFYNTLFAKERTDIVNKSLKKLSENQRDIIYMRFFDGLSIKEIAKKKQCADGTVKATLFQIFQKLRSELTLSRLME